MSGSRKVKPGLPRWVEVPIALLGLVVALPLLVLAALAIRIDSVGPVLFRQQRVGRGFRNFTLYKLRTMLVSNAGMQVTASGDRRVTAVGRLLRKTKLDELPELWNVIRGDMSLVGPRPEVPRYVDETDPMWNVVLQVRPGLTDSVTLRLRNEEELLALAGDDHEQFYLSKLQPYKLIGYSRYLASRNWLVDLKLMLSTFAVVIWPDLAPPPGIEELRQDQQRLEELCPPLHK